MHAARRFAANRPSGHTPTKVGSSEREEVAVRDPPATASQAERVEERRCMPSDPVQIEQGGWRESKLQLGCGSITTSGYNILPEMWEGARGGINGDR